MKKRLLGYFGFFSDSCSNPLMDSTIPKSKKRRKIPEVQLKLDLIQRSKKKDLHGAIALYETAVSQNLKFDLEHFTSLLYLCSCSLADPLLKELAISSGFRIYDHLKSANVSLNEATVTAVARLAGAKGDGDYAFELVKTVNKYVGSPRLRTYDPVLLCFCEKLEAENAYEVEEHICSSEVNLEEPQLFALLKMSSKLEKADRVYGYLQKLRSSIGCVSEATGKIIEDWFHSESAARVGELGLDIHLIREAIFRNGGGWYGHGWIGNGRWNVRRISVDPSGKCRACFEQLDSIDIDSAQEEKCLQSVAKLALETEVSSSFIKFQDWLEDHKDFEAIVDGANVALYQQNFADGGFSISQLDAVVKALCNRSRGKLPLVVLHTNRISALSDDSRRLIDEWNAKGVLYTTPRGSNDDWYWLYAALKLKCSIVTNDEMRDHNFNIMKSSNTFYKWKDKHLIRYTFVKGSPVLRMPTPYSSVIQESEKGWWHVPIAGDETATERTWLCITR